MPQRTVPSLLALLLLAALGPAPAPAQTSGFGLGPTIGVSNGASVADRNPVGLTGKVWVSNRQAVAGLTTFYIGDRNRSYGLLQGDYLFHNFGAMSIEEGLLGLYIGGGVQFTVVEDATNQWAFRAPLGTTYLLDSASIDLYVEVAPTLSVTDPESFRFDGAIGVRYYF